MKYEKKKELGYFSEEIEELEIQTRKLLDGSLKEKTGTCLKRLLEEYDLSWNLNHWLNMNLIGEKPTHVLLKINNSITNHLMKSITSLGVERT